MHLWKLYAFAVVFLLFAGCNSIFKPQYEGCGSDLTVSCSEKYVADDGSHVEKIYDASTRVYTQITHFQGELVEQKSFEAHLDTQGRDSVVFWIDSIGSGGQYGYATIIASSFHPQQGYKTHDTLLSADFTPYKIIAYGENGKQLAQINPNGFSDTCTAGASKECYELVTETAIGGLIIERSRHYLPDQRKMVELTRRQFGANQPLIVASGESFIHYYDQHNRDTLLYWLQTLSDTDTSWTGFTRYEYRPDGSLQRELLFDTQFPGSMQEPVLYGYKLFNDSGKLVEQMGDGLIERYDTKGRVIQSFTQGTADTNFYFYNEQNSLYYQYYVTGSTLRSSDTLAAFTDVIQQRKITYNEQGIIQNRSWLDARRRTVFEERFDESGSRDSIITNTYLNDSTFALQQKSWFDGDSTLLRSYLYNDQGHITVEISADGSTDSCQVGANGELSWFRCKLE